MTDRRALTPTEVVAATTAVLDQAAAEMFYLRMHLSHLDPDNPGSVQAAASNARNLAALAQQVSCDLNALAGGRQPVGS